MTQGRNGTTSGQVEETLGTSDTVVDPLTDSRSIMFNPITGRPIPVVSEPIETPVPVAPPTPPVAEDLTENDAPVVEPEVVVEPTPIVTQPEAVRPPVVEEDVPAETPPVDVVEKDVVEAPAEPETEESDAREPEAREPVVREPVEPAPVVQEPEPRDPVVQEPDAREPVVQEPVVREPVVQDPVEPAPVVQEPETRDPVVQEPDAREPAVQEPVVREPVVQDPVEPAPVVQEPGTRDPVVQEPDAREPVVQEPEVREPAPQPTDERPDQPVDPVTDTSEPTEPEPTQPDPVDPPPAEPVRGGQQEGGDSDTPTSPILKDVLDVTAPAVPPAPSSASGNGPERLDSVEFDTSTTIPVDGGRVTTLQMSANQEISAIEIISGPDHGNATVNPDNTIALVMTGTTYSGALSLDYKVTYADGTTEVETLSLDVAAPLQEQGWGLGRHYMLAEDDNGDIVVEHGDNHRKVYVSESDEALTRAEIAALEGLTESDITAAWLVDNPAYGGSEEMAVATDVGLDIWERITHEFYNDPGSHWLLFERGYEYEDVGGIAARGMTGESELHPLHVTAWGEGDRPVMNSAVNLLATDTGKIVFSDLVLANGVMILTGDDVIYDDVLFTGRQVNVQHSDRITIHDSEIADVTMDVPESEYWHGHTSGMYASQGSGILIDGTTVFRNAWEEDYHMDWSTEGGLPPNIFSHNLYLQNNLFDTTLRDNIITQGASFGVHIRGGGYIEDNVIADNNNAIDFLGGIYKEDGPIGNYTFFADNVVTSAGYKETDRFDGGLSRGVTNEGYQTTFLDNIIAHLADPNNPAELDQKQVTHYALNTEDGTYVYDDTVIYNWLGGSATLIEGKGTSADQNTENVDPAKADQTTLQNFAAQVMGTDSATITEFMEYLIALPESPFDDQLTADDIIAYFQDGFNIEGNGAEWQSQHRFIPNDLAGGVRWENRINWDTEDVPDDYDSADLAGNWVIYSGTTSLTALDMGNHGELDVFQGKLEVRSALEAGEDGASIDVDAAGQIWIGGYEGAGLLDIDIDGGRFANTGDFTGLASIHVTDGQALLAGNGAKMELNAGSELRIEGSSAKVGFDGNFASTAVVQMDDDSTLSFIADEDGFSTIEEFRSGAFGDTTPLYSGMSLDGKLQIDLSSYAGGAASHELIDVDALDGILDDIHVHGLGNSWNAEIVTDYDEDVVRLEISAGTGQVAYSSIGTAGDSTGENTALWAALTAGKGTYDESLPVLHDEGEDDIPEMLGA